MDALKSPSQLGTESAVEFVKLDSEFYYVKSVLGFAQIVEHETAYYTKHGRKFRFTCDNEGPESYPTIMKMCRAYSENNDHWVLEPTFAQPLLYALEQLRKFNLVITLDPKVQVALETKLS